MTKKLNFTLLLIFFMSSFQAQCWKSFTPGDYFSVVIKDDGSLWSWGLNSYGELGTGPFWYGIANPKKIGTDNDWKDINIGSYHVIAVKNDGSLWAWGNNLSGQLGDGTRQNKTSPTRIGTANDWRIVRLSYAATVAIKNDGSLWGWGINGYGQLGDISENKTVPTRIGTAKDWESVDIGGGSHIVAIKTDGSLWAWGNNGYGQSGNGSTLTYNTIPIRVGISNDWSSVTVGYNHTIAIKTDGSLWGWGKNDAGQLGDGSTQNKYFPFRIGTTNDWKSISAKYDHTLAIKNDGSLWAWGADSYGELGDGTSGNIKSTPIRIGTANDWERVLSGRYHTIAVKTDGSFWAWGFNGTGQLGDGTLTNKTIPTQISCSILSVLDLDKSSVKIYPNPAKDYFSINNKEIRQVQLFSLDGKMIKEYSASDKYLVNGLSKGIYILKIQLQNGKVISDKIVKE